mgnify:CR=1 FL=1
MMKGIFPVEKFRNVQTPFYYYDTKLLRDTLNTITREAGRYEGFQVHYAIKANANEKILPIIREAGIGVAMGNANESLKAVADYVTSSVEEDGISQALKHWVLDAASI